MKLRRTVNDETQPTSDGLRELLQAMQNGNTYAGMSANILEVLHERARQVLQRTPLAHVTGFEQDLVAEFFAQLPQRPIPLRDENGHPLEEAIIEGTIVQRLRWIAAESGPQWRLLKSVREHVKTALDNQDVYEPGMPSRIMYRGRLCGPSIARAVAYLKAGSRAPSNASELAKDLVRHYFPLNGVQNVVGRSHRILHYHDASEPELYLLRQHDAWRLASVLFETLGPELSHLFFRKYCGMTLQEIAHEDDTNVARVQRNVQKAIEITRRIAQCTPITGELMLEYFGEMAAESIQRMEC